MTKRPRATISPYRAAAHQILQRARWDLNPESWRSRARVRAWRDRYDGKAVILCNGPSLNRVDFAALEGAFCIGLNKINLLFNRSAFRPNAIVAVNPFVITQNKDFYNETDLPLFLSHVGVREVQARANVGFLHVAHLGDAFARDVSISVNERATVTFVALQVAFHLGFRRVALVGADHTFQQTAPPNTTVVAEGADSNHFDPNYFAHGVQWQTADLADIEVGYRIAAQAYAASGGEVVNATDGGRLEVFRRQSLTDFLKS